VVVLVKASSNFPKTNTVKASRNIPDQGSQSSQKYHWQSPEANYCSVLRTVMRELAVSIRNLSLAMSMEADEPPLLEASIK
jgi:hypothetical protein